MHSYSITWESQIPRMPFSSIYNIMISQLYFHFHLFPGIAIYCYVFSGIAIYCATLRAAQHLLCWFLGAIDGRGGPYLPNQTGGRPIPTYLPY